MVGITPVPYKKLLPLAIIYFIEAFTFTNIFSYVGFMVVGFGLTDDSDEAGYYAGYIGSTFSIAGFLSSFWWGRISDRYGRRPVLLFGCVGGLLSSIMFGFSTSLEMAIAARFMAGILNGNVGVVKGYAADICDKTNQVKGVGVMQLGWGLGGILGPLFGGILSKPCTSYSFCSEDSLLGKFPYLLPNLMSCVASVAAIVSLCIYLPREEPKRPPKKVEMEDYKKLNASEFSVDETEPDLESDVGDDDTAHLETGMKARDRMIAKTQKPGVKWCFGRIEKGSIFRNKIAMLSVISYCVLGASFTMYDEAFPLFALTEGAKGGIGATSQDIGIIGALNGGMAVFTQLILFYPIATRLGFVRLFRLGLLMGALLFFNYPMLNLFLSNRVGLWAGISFLTLCKVLTGQFAFSAATAIISNSCPLTQVGAINGFAQSLVGLLRAFSPAIAGNVLAWGFTNSYGFPLNQYLVFILMSLFLTVGLAMAMRLPRSLDYPYEDPLLGPVSVLKSVNGESDKGTDSTPTSPEMPRPVKANGYAHLEEDTDNDEDAFSVT